MAGNANATVYAGSARRRSHATIFTLLLAIWHKIHPSRRSVPHSSLRISTDTGSSRQHLLSPDDTTPLAHPQPVRAGAGLGRQREVAQIVASPWMMAARPIILTTNGTCSGPSTDSHAATDARAGAAMFIMRAVLDSCGNTVARQVSEKRWCR